MRLLKPSWVSHDGNPIFSIDIHPDGTRLATGGQGEDSGRVVIWNMAPISNEDDEKDASVPKMLCQMDNHLACVNCVRWSNNGRYLASGGDDKVIMIWQTGRYGGGQTVFGSGGKINIEQWRCVSTLRGHTGDILDLAWSPHDAWLASCSVDNTVVVWNAVKFPETLSVLRGHSGLVKGVSWDPVGKYLASQSDDKSLLVWRTVDWQQETNITEPFDECGGTTHVLRLSWSPDGQYLVSAHAMNNSGPTAQIIERDGWKTEKDFVGHRKAITVAKFNPNILSKINKESSKMQHYCCCAIGSRDRSLSIWLTALKRPLVVIHDLFANSVLDVSWSRRGHQLTVCSWDGTVAYIDFSEEEIGRPLSQEEQSSLHQKMYGKSLAMIKQSDSMTTVIENPEMLRLKEQQQENNLVVQQQLQEKARAHYAAKGPINKQIETRTADGRRRITPMFIAPAPDLGDAPLPFNSKSQPTFSSSTESKSKIIIEKRDEIVPARNSSSNTNSNTSNSVIKESSNLSSNGRLNSSVQNTHIKPVSLSGSTLAITTTAVAATTLTTTTITTATSTTAIVTTATTTTPITSITSSTTSSEGHKNGPVATNSTSSLALLATTTIATSTTISNASVTTVANVASVNATTTTTEPTKPMPVEKLHEKTKETKQQKTTESNSHLKRKDIEDVNKPFKRRPGRPPLSEKLVTAAAAVTPKQAVSPPEKEHREVVRPSHSSFHLPALKSEKRLILQVPTGKADSTTVLELDNNVQASVSLTLHKLKYVVDGAPSWEVLLLAKGIALAASSSFVAAACEDNSLSVFTMTGQRMFPSIILPSSISRLICNNKYIMVITTKAHIYVWDVKNQRNMMKNESLHPIMIGGPSDLSIVNSSLTDNGCPIISLSTGKAYVYSNTMACWMLVSNADDIIQQCSDHVPYMPAQISFNGTVLPLASLQAHGKKPSHQACRLFRSIPSMQQTGTLSYMDAQLAAALSLHSSKEYKFWLLTLIRYMAQEGLEARIREVCNNLLGPAHKSKSNSWEAYILGMHKHDLLHEILPIIGSNLRLQRLFTEYQEQLDLVKS